MIIKRAGEEILKGEKSIYLMTPISRLSNDYSFYDYALNYLESIGYDGILYYPYFNDEKDTKDIREWRLKAMQNSTVIAFWMDRHNPDKLGMDMNLYFGYFINDDRFIYGREVNGYKNEDLDLMYLCVRDMLPISNLNEFLSEVKEKADFLFNLDFTPISEIEKYLLSLDKDIYHKIANILSDEEKKYIASRLIVERSCSNCTAYCSGGINKCDRWTNYDFIGKAKVLGQLKENNK